MTAIRASIFVVLLVVGGLAIAPVASTAFVGELIDDSSESAELDESTTTNETTGADVSTFMQASAADADETVDAEMFIVAFENGDNETRTELVSERTTQLEAKLERLEADREELDEQEDELNPAARKAKLATLAVRISSLERAINETQPRAAEAGVDTAALEKLRTNASTLSGPDVAEIARNISGVEPPRGPPEDVPGNDAGPGSNAGGNGENAPINPGNSGNESDHSPGNSGDATDRGSGNGDENGTGSPPVESGNETSQNPAQGPEKAKNKDKTNQNENVPDGSQPESEPKSDAETETSTE
ncbi:hypothetical protein [Halomontanus rarus]|uniref:hypothetical protein n=1 Tax=Halomontanus rarus TaxID=3034020 RepID=UPI0023E7AA10|nr:hypothetical protein [Halovivax sp. TS33]